ncbi:MAG: DUF452 family protein, partial [Spirochaetes bacterium]|nr:DUF452 family protein [Spirochaetota bacterium]
FYQNMFINQQHYDKFQKHLPQRPFVEQLAELQYLGGAIQRQKSPHFPPCNKVLIGTKDKIIFSANQRRFWSEQNTPILEVTAGHFPFYQFDNWEQLLDTLREAQ